MVKHTRDDQNDLHKKEPINRQKNNKRKVLNLYTTH